jgi:hypothetical protein
MSICNDLVEFTPSPYVGFQRAFRLAKMFAPVA